MPNGQVNMGKFLGLWFVYCLLVSLGIGCLGAGVLAVGAVDHAVFHFFAFGSFLIYGLATMVDSIWKSQPWSNTFRSMFDGLIYALTTGAVFCWLWPGH